MKISKCYQIKVNSTIVYKHGLLSCSKYWADTQHVYMPEILNRTKYCEIGVKMVSLFPSITNVSGEPLTIAVKNNQEITEIVKIDERADLTFTKNACESGCSAWRFNE